MESQSNTLANNLAKLVAMRVEELKKENEMLKNQIEMKNEIIEDYRVICKTRRKNLKKQKLYAKQWKRLANKHFNDLVKEIETDKKPY